MNPALQRYLDAASGLSTLTAGKAEKVVKQLVRSGEAASDQVGELVDDLLERQRGNREAMTALVRSETTRAVRAMGLATSSEVERLQRQVADLKRELQRFELETGAGTRSGAPASETGGTSGSASKKTAKKAVKRSGSGKKSGTASSKKSTKKSGKKTSKSSGKKTAKTAKKATKKTSG